MEDSAPLHFVDNAGVRLCLERRGTGPRHVLFAHGWISSRRMWYDVAARLDPDRYTLHLLDFRGCGLSDRPKDHGFEAYAADLQRAIESAGAPVTLVGHSMGGRFAQFAAARRIAGIERVVLLAPGSARALRLAPRRRALAAEAFGSRERIERFQRAAMHRTLDARTMLRIVDDALLCQREHWEDVDERAGVDFAESLTHIDVPVLAIAGANDPLAPPSRVKREVASAIAGCLFVVLKDAGHNLPVEAPDEVALAVERFQ